MSTQITGGVGGVSVHDGGDTIVRSAAAGSASWTDLDLSSIIGAKQSLVELIFRNASAASGVMITVRAKGSTTDYNLNVNGDFGSNSIYHTTGVTNIGRVVCLTNANGVIQFKNSGVTEIELSLASYIN